MSANAASAKSSPQLGPAELFPAMRFRDKTRLVGICCLALIPAVGLLWRLVGPSDPFGAVTLVYHPNPAIAMLVLIVYAAAGSALATVLMGGRLTDFGVFATGVGLTGLGLRGGDLTVVLQYEAGSAAARGSVFGTLAVDALLWIVVPAAALAAGAVTEAWLGFMGPAGPGLDTKPPVEPKGVLNRWLVRMGQRTGTTNSWMTELRHGLLTTLVTAVVAMVIIRIVAGRHDGPVDPGQVCFAIGVGFWLGSLAACQFCRPALGIWACLSVPIVAVIGYVAAAMRPDLTGPLVRYSEVAIIAPNALVRGLPVIYLAIGPAAAILGIWTGQRIQRLREEAAES